MADSRFISFFRKAGKNLDKEDATAPTEVKTAADLAKKYRHQYPDVDLDVLRNLNDLKKITTRTKTDKPDDRYKEIKKRLGDPETEETLRQERWGKKIACPYCKSSKIKKLDPTAEKTDKVFKYQCLDCKESFNDRSESDIETGVPPLYVWMMCWYLYGCTNSLQYIARKLGLELGTVESMIAHIQKLFGSDQPLSNFTSFEEWSQKQGKQYKKIFEEAATKQEVLFRGDTAKAPGDTAEYRRQKNRGPKPRT